MSKKRINIAFDFEANMGPVKSAVTELQRILGGINLPTNIATNFEKLFDKLNSEMTEFEALTRSGFSDMADVRKAQTSFGRIQKILNQINIESSRVKGIDPNKLIPKEVSVRVSGLLDKWKALEAQSKKKDGFAKKIEKQKDAISEQERALERLKTKREALNEENRTMGSLKGAVQAQKKADQKKLDKAKADRTALEHTRGGKSSAEYAALGQEITRLGQSIRDADKEISRLTTDINTNKATVARLGVEIGAAESELGDMRTELTNLEKIDIDPVALKELREELASILSVGIGEIPTDLTKIKEAIEKIPEEDLVRVRGAMDGITSSTRDLDGATHGAADGLDRVSDETKELSDAAKDIENLKNSILQFFSLTNTVQLFKRTIQSALNTVKELDATMTEAAVVTEFSVGDMWEKLPEYSKQAQQLGVSINGMYQATTLYYQQGLKTNEAMAVGAETMKMAKIAAMDSTQATEAMTAALRGFNMELNETSAVRVNDVYSQLAAVTAADTSQIATAMEKTASIAASANMEFETTAAFLSQIIETTQEAPETAGTALKTIIARFSEVKNLREKGLTSGEDEEGEIIDVNKIQTALRSVGISMSDYFAGTEGLDQVLIKLAEKWDTLNFETQRYIATMAAGSRQQSRFIAMMSDYKRTAELVAAANNSAGASQKQYAKTLDSMESKLTRLKNAWDEFTMGLANNEVLKFGIDFLTNLLETINKITDSISGENGLAKSMISLIMVMGALKGGRALIGGVTEKFGMFGGPVKETITETPSGDGRSTVRTIVREPYKEGLAAGKEAGVGFTAGFRQGIQGAKGVTGLGKIKAFGAGLFSEGYEIDAEKEEKAQLRLSSFIGSISPGEIGEHSKALDKLNNKLLNNEISSKDAAKAIKDMGFSLDFTTEGYLEASEESKKFTYTTQSVANGIASVGAVTITAGVALSMLGQEIAKTNEGLGKTIQSIGQWTTAIGGVAQLVPGVVKTVEAYKKLDAAAKASAQSIGTWTIIITLAIAAIAAIVNASNEFQEAKGLSKQFEAINEQIDSMNNILSEATAKIDELSDKKNELSEMEKSFEGLTKGTTEWREQLIKANSAILEMIEKNPELGAYIVRGEQGQLKISDEGYAVAQEQAIKQQSVAMNAISALQIEKNNLQVQQDFEEQLQKSDEEAYNNIQSQRAQADLDYKTTKVIATGVGTAAAGAVAGMAIGAALGSTVPIVGTAIGAVAGLVVGGISGMANVVAEDLPGDIARAEKKATGGLTQEQFTDFAAAAAESGASISAGTNKDDFKIIYNSMGYDADFERVWESMQKMGQGFDELANSALSVKIANESMVRSAVDTAAQSSKAIAESDFLDAATSAMVEKYDDYGDKVQNKKEEIQAENKEEDKQTRIEEYAKLVNKDISEVKKEIEDGKLTEDDIITALAADQVTQDVQKDLESTIQHLDKVTKNMSKRDKEFYKGVFSKDTTKTSLDSLDNAAKTQEDWTNFIAGKNLTAEELALLGYNSVDEYAKALYDEQERQKKLVEDAYKEVGGKQQIYDLNKYLIESGATGLSTEQSLEWSKVLEGIKLRGGNEEQILSMIPQLTEGLYGQELDQAMNILKTASWDTTTDIDQTITALQELGGEIDQQLVENLYNATNAVKKIDLASLEKQLQSLDSIVKDLEDKTKTGQGIFTTEQKENLVKQGKLDEKLFVRIGFDEWASVETTNDLLNNIEQLTDKILQEIKGTYEKNIARGGMIEAALQDWYKVGTGEEGSVSGVTLTGTELIEQLKNGERDALGAGGTNNIGTDELKRFAKAMGITEGQMTGLDDSQIIDLVVTIWEEYYGPGGSVYLKNQGDYVNTARETFDWQTANVVGTEDYYKLVDQYKEKWEEILSEQSAAIISMPAAVGSEQDNIYKKYFSPDYSLESNGTKYNIYEPNIADFLKAMIGQEGFKEFYKEIPGYQDIITDIAQKAGIENAENLSADFLYDEIIRLYELEDDAERVVDALISSTSGATEMTNQFTKALSEQGSAIAKDESLIKQLTIATTKTNDLFKDFGEVVENSSEVLEEGAVGTQRYSAALENIALYMGKVVGGPVSTDFINQNRELFLEIQKGGEKAAAAYEELMWRYMAATEGMTMQAYIATDAGQIIQQALRDASSNGGAIDLTSYIAELQKLPGYTEEIAKNTLSTWFTVMSNPDTGLTGGVLNDWSAMFGTSVESEKEDKWENPYDKFYNTLERINEAMRERERLERRYQKMIKSGSVSANELNKNRQQELAVLQREAELQNDIIKGRKDQINQFIGEKGLGEYAYIGKNEFTGADELRIDWAEINTITDSEKGSEVEEYISQLEEWFGSIEDAQDALWEIEDNTEELENRGKDEYLEMEQMIKDALVDSYQKQIDKLSEINQAINDGNAKMIEAMQSSIEEQRQARENQKVEDDIADKQNRLAYLQRDTSGANAMEILQLQKEIDEAQEDYTDTLIDQKIQDLQDQNDAAAEQRERQINIAQQQLEHWVTTGNVWKQVESIIDNISTDTDNILGDEALKTLLGDSVGFDGMSKVEQMDWMNKTNSTLADGLSWLKKEKTETDTTKGSINNPDLKTTQSTNPTKTEPETQQKKTDNDIMRIQAYLKGSGEYTGGITGESSVDLNEAINAYRQRRRIGKNVDILKDMQSRTYSLYAGRPFQGNFNLVDKSLYSDGEKEYTDSNGITWVTEETAMRNGVMPGLLGTIKRKEGRLIKYYPIDRFKTGGLADYTGPAWLDGTKSHPELVLNARDTQNFIQLKDILASLMSGKTETSGNSGDSIYDIDINVETIQNKEDLDTIAKYIEDKIVASASYRNNNLVKSRR